MKIPLQFNYIKCKINVFLNNTEIIFKVNKIIIYQIIKTTAMYKTKVEFWLKITRYKIIKILTGITQTRTIIAISMKTKYNRMLPPTLIITITVKIKYNNGIIKTFIRI